ncbi:MAG: cache domain-containing protein, partial [Bacteroidales bacterium]|nr:cache domain-containing protein [Bacteroidales bacterium]
MHTVFKSANTPVIIYFIVGLVIAGITIAAGYSYYQRESETIRREREKNLKSMARLKSRQITSWFNDELYDVKVISQNISLNSEINHWLQYKTPREPGWLVQRLASIKDEHNLRRINLCSPEGKLLLSTGPGCESVDTSLIPAVKRAVKTQSTVSTGLFMCGERNEILIAFLSPIFNSQDKPAGVLICQLNPDDFLYPLIRSSSTSNEAGETYIVKKTEDSVQYLNTLPDTENLPLQYRVSLAKNELASVKA